MAEPLLDIRDLRVTYAAATGEVEAVRDVSLAVMPGEILAVVGESGSGKTTLAAAAIRLLPPNARIDGGSIRLRDEDITGAGPARLRALRGATVSMIFQQPRASLNPVRRIGLQIADALRAHRRMDRCAARSRTIAQLRAVRMRDPERIVDAYPHQLSDGMCQRVMIAIALACEPALLIADEPTAALDPTTERAVMDLLAGLIRDRGMALLLITHDLGLAARHADRVAVMADGRLVETAATGALFAGPRSPQARRLIAATPRRDSRIEDLSEERLPPRRPEPAPRGPGGDVPPPILEVRDLCRRFGDTIAVDGVSFDVRRGESLGLVGESGAGKSTIARLVSRLMDPSSGRILFCGEDIGAVGEGRFHAAPQRRRIQLVFQDPGGSLDPRLTAFDAIAAPLRRLEGLSGARLAERVDGLADQVRLPRDLLGRKPHRLSGGQMARVGIARAIAVSPDLLVLDEPTAALDVSVQAVILTLLERLRRDLGLSYLFISHDLTVVRMMCERALVLQAGRIVEEGDSQTILTAPRHPYTQALVEAVPHFAIADDIG